MNFKANKHKVAILIMNVKMISWNSELCGWLKAIFVLIKIYISKSLFIVQEYPKKVCTMQNCTMTSAWVAKITLILVKSHYTSAWKLCHPLAKVVSQSTDSEYADITSPKSFFWKDLSKVKFGYFNFLRDTNKPGNQNKYKSCKWVNLWIHEWMQYTYNLLKSSFQEF